MTTVQPQRTRLPNRRPSATVELNSGSLTMGFDPATGMILEVFGNDRKSGNHLLADTCVVVSLALQHGISVETMQRSLGTVPIWTGYDKRIDGPASIVGEILAAVVDASAEVAP